MQGISHFGSFAFRRQVGRTVFIWVLHALPIAFLLLVTGCGTLPPRADHTVSVAVHKPAGTRLWTAHAGLLASGDSAFRLIPEPAAALEERLQLIAEADRTLDLQYYIWSPDKSGMSLLRALRDAAARGVRVRLLLDDFNMAESDTLLQAFSGFDNVQIRLFNPFPVGRGSTVGKVLWSLADLRRISHRMHNKLLVADDVAAIVGGRNIGDAYLAAGDGNFVDVDVLTVGSVVSEMSESFDDYWNSQLAYVGAQLWGHRDKAGLRLTFDAMVSHLPSAVHAGSDNFGQLYTCPARFFADPVEKAEGVDTTESSESIYRRLLLLFEKSNTEIYAVSPYFVRGHTGMLRIKSLIDRGVRVRILTNSLASTDVIAAHAAYVRYRLQLVSLGVDLRELSLRKRRGDASTGLGLSGGRLHAKMAIVDQRWLYVGSFNFTSRSERLNTELGLILDCPSLARQAIQVLERAPVYELRLGQLERSVEWVHREDSATERVWKIEPETTLWQRLKSALFIPFVPEQDI